MNLTVHMVRSDLTRMRGWIACWVGLLLLPIIVGATLLVKSPLGAEDWNLPSKAAILAGLQVVVGYILTILLLHEHRIVGTNQFWLTRPISRGRLLAAKALGVFLMIGMLPVMISVPWWLSCGFTVGQMLNAGGETLLVMMLVALPAGLMAVLTDSFPRALLWTVVLVALLLFGMLSFTIVNAATAESGHDHSLVISRSVVVVFALAVVMLGIVVAQFFLRRRGWWLAAAGGLAVALVLAAFRWPWGWIPIDPAEFEPALANGVKLRFERAIAGPPPRERKPGQEVFQPVHTQFVVSGVPKGFDAHGIGMRQRWDTSTGGVSRKERYWESTFPPESMRGREVDAETERWRAQKSEPRPSIPLAADEAGLNVTSYIQPSMVARMQSEPPKYHARVWWLLARPQVLFELPIAISGRLTREGRGIRVAHVERGSTFLEVTTVETRPVTIRSMLNDEADRNAWYHHREQRDGMLLLTHRGRNEYINQFGHDLDDDRRVIINGVEISWRRRAPVGQQVIRDGKWQHLRPRIDGDTLGLLIWKDAAVFSRWVDVERLEMTAAK